MTPRIFSALLLLPCVFVACSSDSEGTSSKGSGSGDDPQDGIFDDGSGLSGGVDGGAGFGRNGVPCAAETVATEAAPLDIYVMFDQSCSMSCPSEQGGPGLCCIGGPRPRIDQVRGAMEQFLGNPASTGIGVGIGYFGNFPLGNTSCNPNDYSRPAVEIGLLPDNAPALLDSLHGAQPTGETPTGAAIRGACQYATSWKRTSVGHQVVILLVTDGFPEAPVSGRICQPSVEDAANAASECLNGAQIPTYVLGVGQNLDNLSRLAESGGTGQAYLTGGSTDVSGAVLDALNAIRDSASIPCSFKVPPPPSGETLNPALVNVTLRDAQDKTRLIGGVGTAAACGAPGGWYYNDPGAPTTLELCPTTCNVVTAALIAGSALGRVARLDMQYGCDTVEITR